MAMPSARHPSIHLALAAFAALAVAGCSSATPSAPVVATAGSSAPAASAQTGTPASKAAPTPTPTAPPTPAPTATPFPAAFVQGEPYAPAIDPADFVAVVDNPYLPWIPGTTWTYAGGGERTVTRVLPETRVILGVTVTVVHDRVFSDGELAEDTFDWYAQDRAGNVWYFGERTEELEGGVVTSTAGSWEAGVDGAQPGIVMPADPVIGLTYRQEFYAGEAEDLAKTVELGATAKVPAGSYQDVIVSEEWTPLEPAIHEHKLYAPGVGLVQERVVQGGKGVVSLVKVEGP